jgi:hypothetical protein
VFVLANALYPSADVDLVWTGLFTAIIFAFVFVGALLSARVPDNAVGPVILFSGALLATTIAIGTLGLVWAGQGDVPVEVLAVAAIVNDFGFQVPILVILIGVPLIFPDGHLLSKRWRWIVAMLVWAMGAVAFTATFGPGPLGAAEIDNPFEIPAIAPLVEAVDTIASLSSVIGFGAAVLAVVLRYRRGDDVQRHQLKWLIAVATAAAIAFPIAFNLPDTAIGNAGFLAGLVAMLALPVVIAIAIFRYRLYEIDRIISRTIAWAVISGLLVGSFAVLVVGLQGALDGVTQGETLAVAASTLAVAALFQPLRRRVQGAVDRRFDRAAYDAQRTADAFAERLRDEVDLDTLAAELERTVAGAMRPTTAAVWLPPRGSAR